MNKAAKLPNPRVIVDTREQRPYRFGWMPAPAGHEELHLGGVDEMSLVRSELGGPWEIERGTLAVGDYSLAPVEGHPAPPATLVSVERKSESDIIGSLSAERGRVWREMAQLAEYSFKAFVVEAPISWITSGRFRDNGHAQRVNIKSLFGSLLAIGTDFQIQVVTCTNRREAEYATAWILRRAWHWWLERGSKGIDTVESPPAVTA